jgi:hypothetical protein
VSTSLFETPTLSFGEVGLTGDQKTTGYHAAAHGVGQFDKTVLLERMALIDVQQWALTDAPGQLYLTDIDNALRNYPRNKAILQQFKFYRSDIEVTLRLNTNQFYFGALMATMWPTNLTGDSLAERSVLDPTIISASCADSVVKTWEYTFPDAWKRLDSNLDPVYFSIDNLTPLAVAKTGMPDSITIQIWARFKNIILSYPTPSTITMQSDVAVAVPKRPKKSHPAQEKHSVDTYQAIRSRPITNAIAEVTGTIEDGFNIISKYLPFFFDKPDCDLSQIPVINEASSDLFTTDGSDTNVSVTLYRGKYVDPALTRMPMTKNWSVADYSRIPGIIQDENGGFYNTFTSTGDLYAYAPGSGITTPLAYCFDSSLLTRGSFKVCLQFFTSSFISARFAVEYRNSAYTTTYPTDYTDGISRIVNVKGDTTDSFVLPYLAPTWWVPTQDPQTEFRVTCISTIASSDSAADPVIYLVVWISGGDDIQFAMPSVPVTWGTFVPPADLTEQSAIGKIFERPFDPIVENLHSDLDTNYCTTEQLGPILDLVKRYSIFVHSSTHPIHIPLFDAILLDRIPDATNNLVYSEYYAFRRTLFGNWRSCFLFRSGGYRFRAYEHGVATTRSTTKIVPATGFLNDTFGLQYQTPFDQTDRLTIPQLAQNPYLCLLRTSDARLESQLLSLSNGFTTADAPIYLAARDDVQFGYPILPRYFSLPTA